MNSAAATLADEPLGDPRAAAGAPSDSALPAGASNGAPRVQELRAALAELGADASRVVEVESLRLRAKVDRKLSRWAGVALLVLMGLAALAMSGVLLARGLSGALGALFGGPAWLGPLLAGLLIPALALGTLRLQRARRAARRMERARELAVGDVSASAPEAAPRTDPARRADARGAGAEPRGAGAEPRRADAEPRNATPRGATP